jgi:hypothetical protein
LSIIGIKNKTIIYINKTKKLGSETEGFLLCPSKQLDSIAKQSSKDSFHAKPWRKCL